MRKTQLIFSDVPRVGMPGKIDLPRKRLLAGIVNQQIFPMLLIEPLIL
jgi:hypothetical protein